MARELVSVTCALHRKPQSEAADLLICTFGQRTMGETGLQSTCETTVDLSLLLIRLLLPPGCCIATGLWFSKTACFRKKHVLSFAGILGVSHADRKVLCHTHVSCDAYFFFRLM